MSSTRIRKWLVPIGAAALMFAVFAFPAASFADQPGGCDFSSANNGIPDCTGPVGPQPGGSTFAGGDGNLLTSPTTFGSTDWQNAPGLHAGFDLPSGTSDNSFGQGTKEDDPNVSVVTGSIPPNKSDLTRFYEASETTANGNTYLYLAWERTNVLGTANFDFEFNQKSQPDLTTTGKKTLVRTAGDLLVTYDFTNGGGKPVLGLLSWLTSATTPAIPGFATNSCLSAHSFPCWGDEITLTSANSAGAVNNLGSVTDPLFPNSPNYINPVPALQFGEAAINLTGSGVFPPGACEALNSAFVRSRSSASFTAEIKDFIAPVPVNISNCGAFAISKVSSKGGALTGATFSVTKGGSPITGSPFTITDPSGTLCLTKLVPGTYTVTETAAPTGYAKDLTPQDVTIDNTSTCANKTVTFTDTPLTDITATATSEATGGTASHITCRDASNNIVGESVTGNTDPAEADATGLLPGQYTCTIVIDP
jgi:Prealbumin-like fold domain